MKKTPYQIAVEDVAQEIVDNLVGSDADVDELRDASDEAGEIFADDVMEAIAKLQKK